jgi:hypothetical protein
LLDQRRFFPHSRGIVPAQTLSSDHDDQNAPPVVIINAEAARRFYLERRPTAF